MKVIHEFRNFVAKGNVVDLAVGVIIGGAFGKIVDSMVKDLITPMIAFILKPIGGQPDFSKYAYGAVQKTVDGKPVLEGGIMYGNFINSTISFTIIAAVIFFVFVKPMARLKALANKPVDPQAPPPPLPDDIKLLTEIRDLLKGQQPKI